MTLPATYPDDSLPTISISTRNDCPVTKAEGAEILDAIQGEIQELQGDECIFQAVDIATAKLEDLLTAKDNSLSENSVQGTML